MNYLDLLEQSYKEENTERETGKFEFLADAVFDFTTYENTVSAMMARKALEVCKAISDKKTFEYISSEEGNLWYLITVNMPFFENKLEWGTSIRGAWWDLYGDKTFSLESCSLFYSGEQELKIEFTESQWLELIMAMIKFTEE